MKTTFVDLSGLMQFLHSLGLPRDQFDRLYAGLKRFGSDLPVLDVPLGYVVIAHDRELGAVVACSLPFDERPAKFVRFFHPEVPAIVEVDHSKGMPVPKGISVNLNEYNELVNAWQRDRVRAIEGLLQQRAQAKADGGQAGSAPAMSQADAIRELERKIVGPAKLRA